MDPYQTTDAQSDTVVDAIITRLEDRGKNAHFNRFIQEYLDVINWQSTSDVLDLGCGTGVVTREIRKRLTTDAQKIIGVDLSEKLLNSAMQFSKGLDIHWLQASADALPIEDASIDLVVLHTLMSHVPSPVKVLKEVYRILRSGGRAVVFDADYASSTFANADWEKGREVDLKLYSAVVANLDVCRQMPSYFVDSGLKLESCKAHVIAEAGKGDFWLSSVRGFEKLIPALNILPEDQGKAWVSEMLANHEAGRFFAATNYYTFFVSK